MVTFKNLFSFSKKEIAFIFKHATVVRNIKGLKLLVCNHQSSEFPITHGKLLIITPRKVGKAHDRNKLRRRIKDIFYTQKLYKYPVYSIILTYKDSLKLDFKQLTEFFVKGIVQ